MRYASRVAGVVAGLLVVLGAGSSAWAHGKKDPPKRVLILVVDQFRPDYVDKFDMRNVRALMRDGVNFGNAYLGHMASETVITHNVITSGQQPEGHGLGRRGVPRHRERARRRRRLDVDLRLAHARPVQHC